MFGWASDEDFPGLPGIKIYTKVDGDMNMLHQYYDWEMGIDDAHGRNIQIYSNQREKFPKAVPHCEKFHGISGAHMSFETIKKSSAGTDGWATTKLKDHK